MNPSPSALTAAKFMISQIVVAGGSLLVNVASARSMGPSGRGGLALLLQVAYVGVIVGVGGLDRAYPASVERSPSLGKAIAEVARLLAAWSPIVLVACLGLGFVLGQGGVTGLVTGLGLQLTVIGLIGATGMRTAAAAAGSANRYVWGTVASQALVMALAGALALGGIRAPQWWIAGYGLALSAGALVMWLGRPTPTPALRSASELATTRRVGVRLLPATLASLVVLRSDRLLLPWLSTFEQLGLYAVVATLTEVAVWPVQSYADAHVPAWRQALTAGDFRPGITLLTGTGLAAAGAAGLGVLAHLLLVPVFGASYAGAVRLIWPLAVGAGVYAIGRVAVGISVAAGRAAAVLAADIPAMAVAVPAYVILIPLYGAWDAAIASMIAYSTNATLAVLTCLGACRRPTRRFRDDATVRVVTSATAQGR